MGKIIPADDPVKLTDFIEKKYDAFNKVYDACKEVSEKIDGLKMADSPLSSVDTLSVKITTDTHTLSSIQEACKTDPNITVSDGVITAKG